MLRTSASGGAAQINSYDAFGVPGSGNSGRFQYTRQAWLPELGMYYYKARMYSPALGRFMQTDPIGYEDQVNLYAYVANDPVNGTDPTGMASICVANTTTEGATRTPACVKVDGDGDGKWQDNDLSPSQRKQFRRDFGDFIRANRGKDLSKSGKEITGEGSLSEKASARVASQFVGYAVSSSGDKNLQAGWGKLKSIWLGSDPAEGAPAWSDGISRMGIDPSSRWFRAGPSNIARMMLHEPYHMGFGNRWGGSNFLFFWGQHSELDDMAKRQLKRSGLAGGGCLPNFPFSGC